MRNLPVLALFTPLVLLSTVDCMQVVAVEPVTLVPTRTPGVTFVVVRPVVAGTGDKRRVQPRDNAQVDPNSEYILMCDARPADGMRCSVPTEAALARYSYAPMTGNADAPIDEGVGTLADVSTHVTKEGEEDKAAEAPASESASPPPPPPPPPAAATAAPKESK
jgi:hypothetical protein